MTFFRAAQISALPKIREGEGWDRDHIASCNRVIINETRKLELLHLINSNENVSFLAELARRGK